MAAGSMHPERTVFHEHAVDADHVVVSVEIICDNGVSLYPDPIEGDCQLELGAFCLWRKDLVGGGKTDLGDLPTHMTEEPPCPLSTADVSYNPSTMAEATTHVPAVPSTG